MFSNFYMNEMPVPVAARSKASVCGRSPAEIVGFPPGEWMFVCCECCVRRADHSSRGVLPTVVCHRVWSRNLRNEEAMTHVGSQRHRKKKKQKIYVCVCVCVCVRRNFEDSVPRTTGWIQLIHVKRQQNSFWFQSDTTIYFYFYSDDMFRPTVRHQAIFTKLRIRCV